MRSARSHPPSRVGGRCRVRGAVEEHRQIAVDGARDGEVLRAGAQQRGGGRRIEGTQERVGEGGIERVYDIAGNAANGADVDLATCTPQGQGADSLCSTWRDPDFDPRAQALYYARVVENPSCRWTQWACNARHVDCAAGAPSGLEACCDPQVPKTIQERAWTSPIWVSPSPRP